MTTFDGPMARAPHFVDDVDHPTPAERTERGQRARRDVSRASHGAWQPSLDRRDPISILEEQAISRDPDLVPIRYSRMAESPFAFYRGAAAIMAHDLVSTTSSGIDVQLCGDAHLLNFGMFHTGEQALTFDLNDFDETLPGPWEWDVKRLAASFEVAGRDLHIGTGKRRAVVVALVGAYRDAMSQFSAMGNLDLWHVRLDVDRLLDDLLAQKADPERIKRVKRSARKALGRNHLTAFERLVEETPGGLRFAHEPPQLVPVEFLLDEDSRLRYQEVIATFLGEYRSSLRPVDRHIFDSYRFVHIARKVVGVGSVGTRSWVVLLVGRDDDDPLILQLKEAQGSVLEGHLGPSSWPTSGERVVHGQRLMQGSGDPLLGWYSLTAFDGRHHEFYVRQLWDGKASIDLAGMSSGGLADYGRLCGWTIARAHARTGDRIAIASYIGTGDRFGEAIASFASTYADVNEADHRTLLAAIESGRLRVSPSE